MHSSIVVSPDNESRKEINQIIRREMQVRGQVDHREYPVRTLVARQEITGADRQWAGQYELGDVVRYTRGSKVHGIEADEYARVERVNEKDNRVTMKRGNGQQMSYDPRRLHGVTPVCSTMAISSNAALGVGGLGRRRNPPRRKSHDQKHDRPRENAATGFLMRFFFNLALPN